MSAYCTVCTFFKKLIVDTEYLALNNHFFNFDAKFANGSQDQNSKDCDLDITFSPRNTFKRHYSKIAVVRSFSWAIVIQAFFNNS
jgi:hypothetical protein